MTNMFKKLVLAVAMLGCMGSMQAAEDNRKSTASSGKVALATLGMAAGAFCTSLGFIGCGGQAYAFYPVPGALPSSLSQQLSSTASYAPLIILGPILILGSTLYCAKSAKGGLQKLRSLFGSSVATAGGFVLAVGLLGYMAADAQRTRSLWTTVKDAAWWGAHGVPPIPGQYAAAAGLSGALIAACGGFISVVGYAIQPVDNGKTSQS